MRVRSYAAQKAALTKAVKTQDAAKIEAECRRAVAEWESGQPPYTHGWPDDWSRWQRALDDIRPWNTPRIDLRDF